MCHRICEKVHLENRRLESLHHVGIGVSHWVAGVSGITVLLFTNVLNYGMLLLGSHVIS